MRKVYHELTSAFRRNKGRLSKELYYNIVAKNTTIFEDSDTIIFLLQASGYPIIKYKDGYLLKTYVTPIDKQKFCIIDIETNGSKPENSQIIEVGAIMLQNNKIIDRFESFINCTFLPEYITKVTGITSVDLVDAPQKVDVLIKLREFIGDSIFVAHNANFDFNFLSYSFERFGLGSIGNQKICSIDLAQRTIKSDKYGLAYLNKTLNLGVDIHHRAYSDALTTSRLFKILLKNLPQYVKTADDLVRYSISSKKDRTNNIKK